MYSGAVYVPIFHVNETVNIKAGKGNYALYHGNLSVPENENAALYLIHKVFNDINVKLIISGRNPSTRLLTAVNKNSNVIIEANIQSEDLLNLINNAQINILPTSQKTGMKLKLINALYNGRYCIVNSKMITDKILEECCIVADSAEEMKKAVLKYASREINKNNIVKRTKILQNNYSDKMNADNLISIVY